MFSTALVCSGFAMSPLYEMMWPRNFLDFTPNEHLVGLNFNPTLLSVLTFFQVISKVSDPLIFCDDVVNIYFNIPADLLSEDLVD